MKNFFAKPTFKGLSFSTTADQLQNKQQPLHKMLFKFYFSCSFFLDMIRMYRFFGN